MGICRQVASIDRIPHTSYPPLCPLYRALAIPSGHLRYRHPSIIYIVYPAGQGWTLRPDWSRDRGRVIKYIKKGKKHRFDIFFLSIGMWCAPVMGFHLPSNTTQITHIMAVNNPTHHTLSHIITYLPTYTGLPTLAYTHTHLPTHLPTHPHTKYARARVSDLT